MIPTEERITNALLMEVYAHSNHAATTQFIYDELVNYFEDELESSDLEKRDPSQSYPNSKSIFSNHIQRARQHLVYKGLILTPEENKRGEWKLSNEGIKVGQELFIMTYQYDPWAEKSITIENITEEIIEKFKPFDQLETFPEGKLKFSIHVNKERNKILVALKKKLAFNKNPLLPCEICGTSFKEEYGDIGERFIEAHHIFPISELTAETDTKIEDLILICSNCHVMIHHKRPWLSIEQMKNLLANNNNK